MNDETKSGLDEARPEEPKGSEQIPAVRRSLQVSNAKVFIGGVEIGIAENFDFNVQYDESENITIFEPVTACVEFKIDDDGSAYRYFKSLFKMPRKMKKRINGTRKAKNKLFKMIKYGIPVTIKHIKRAGYEVKPPANYA